MSSWFTTAGSGNVALAEESRFNKYCFARAIAPANLSQIAQLRANRLVSDGKLHADSYLNLFDSIEKSLCSSRNARPFLNSLRHQPHWSQKGLQACPLT